MTERKILPAPGINHITGFSGYRPLTIKEINKNYKLLLQRNNNGLEIEASFCLNILETIADNL